MVGADGALNAANLLKDISSAKAVFEIADSVSSNDAKIVIPEDDIARMSKEARAGNFQNVLDIYNLSNPASSLHPTASGRTLARSSEGRRGAF